MKRLRVATLNIWNNSGPWPQRLELIRAQASRLDPDVLGLQEVLERERDGASDGVWAAPDSVPADSQVEQASAIAAGAGRHIAYASAWALGDGLHFGNALLSRYPIAEHRAFRLPGEDSGETRGLLFAAVDHPEGRLPVFVTHLNWKLHHGSVRVKQVRFIADRVKELAPTRGSALPPVVMGDFNAEPESDEIRFMTGLATVDDQSVFFADSWRYAGSGPGYTFDRENRFAATAHEYPRRIDYIFVRGPDRELRGEPIETRLVFDEPGSSDDGQIWPSDHFGLTTDLVLSPRTQ